MLVNIPIALLQFLIWPIVFYIVLISSFISLSGKFRSKGIMLALKQINSNNEKALLLISTACLNQFFNINSSQYINRISCYLAGICILGVLCLHYNNYKHLKRYESINNNIVDKQKNIKNKNDNNQPESGILLVLLENLDFQQRPRLITYFFFG